MKRSLLLALVLAILLCALLVACKNQTITTIPGSAGNLTFVSNIAMSDEAGSPSVNNCVQTITLKFSEPLDAKTISGAVKFYKIDSQGNPNEEPCIVKTDPGNPAILEINNKKVEKLPEGEEYKVVISSSLRSQTGLALEKEFIGYFATNHNFNLIGNADLNNSRSQVVVISDLHLGLDDAFAEINRNRQAVMDFLNQIRNSPNVKELVIAGDLLDEWFLPMDYHMPRSEPAFVDAIAANNQAVIDAVNGIIDDGNIKVTYIPGNHDMLVTATDIQRILPGIGQARDGSLGLGTYITGASSEIAIEHGHRYDFVAAPDPISNRSITNNDSSILPPGYFFTRIATSSFVEGHPSSNNTFPEIIANETDESQFGYYLYAKGWETILSNFTVKEALTDKVIKTNIDGFTETYAINDLIPQQDPQTGILDVNLYKGMQDTWEERQSLNGVKAKIPLQQAITKVADSGFIDSQAKTQYFDLDASRRIVVFGHTHVAHVDQFTNLEGKNTIYANSGTWIDNAQGYPTMTFLVITLPNTGSTIESVNLYKYSANKTITQWDDGCVITTR